MELSPEVKELLAKHRPNGKIHIPTAEEHRAREREIYYQWSRMNEVNKAKAYLRRSLWPTGIPIEFTFKDWDPSKQANEQAARAIGNRAWKLATQLEQQSFNVVLLGSPGTGKTSLALAMAIKINQDSGKSYSFISTSELKRIYDSRFEMGDLRQKISDTLRAMKEVSVLVLDDFGTEGGLVSRINEPGYKGVRSDMQDGIYQVANARYQAHMTTIITTNNTNQELIRMYDPKIISRLITKQKEHRIAFNGMEDVRAKEG